MSCEPCETDARSPDQGRLLVGLVQLLIILALRIAAGLPWNPASETSAVPAPASASPQAGERPSQQQQPAARRRSKDTGPYSPAKLDGALANFVAITEPEHLPLLASPPSDQFAGKPLALGAWSVLAEADGHTVYQHPTQRGLYAVRAHFPDIPLRQLFEIICDVGRRKSWDTMSQAAEEIERLDVGGRRVSIAWIGMKGMALLKPKVRRRGAHSLRMRWPAETCRPQDLLLMSIVARLPAKARDDGKQPIRLICATSSVNDPRKPPQSGFSRMDLTVSGFIAEEHGEGSAITQITDLSGLGGERHTSCSRVCVLGKLTLGAAWVPGAVIKTVTTALIPKSLDKLGRAARAYNVETDSRYPVDSDEWMPRMLGEFTQEPEAEGGDGAEGGEQAEAELHTLVEQLQSVTARLSTLEGRAAASWRNLYGLIGGGRHAPLLAAAGGAAGALAIAALAAAMRRRRRIA